MLLEQINGMRGLVLSRRRDIPAAENAQFSEAAISIKSLNIFISKFLYIKNYRFQDFIAAKTLFQETQRYGFLKSGNLETIFSLFKDFVIYVLLLFRISLNAAFPKSRSQDIRINSYQDFVV